jgi:hypothetical protein
MKRTTRGFFCAVAETELRHERGQRQVLLGLCEQIVSGAHVFP